MGNGESAKEQKEDGNGTGKGEEETGRRKGIDKERRRRRYVMQKGKEGGGGIKREQLVYGDVVESIYTVEQYIHMYICTVLVYLFVFVLRTL